MTRPPHSPPAAEAVPGSPEWAQAELRKLELSIGWFQSRDADLIRAALLRAFAAGRRQAQQAAGKVESALRREVATLRRALEDAATVCASEHMKEKQ